MLRAGVAQLMIERGTGHLVRHYQGGALAKPAYKVDTGLVSLIGQLLAHEKQAADRRSRDRRKDGDGPGGPGVSHQPEQPVGARIEGRHAKRGQASPDDGDALALTLAQTVPPLEKEEHDEDDEFGGNGGINGPGSWMR
jgi:hypothetical protein